MNEVRPDPYTLEARQILFRALKNISSNNGDLLDSIRSVAYKWNTAGLPENKIYWGFVALESETDDTPRGNARQSYTSEELQELDESTDQYLRHHLPSLIEACQQLLAEYKGEKLFREEKVKLKIREIAGMVGAGETDPLIGIKEILDLWPQTEFEENDLYYFLLGSYESGAPSSDGLRQGMQDLIAYCDEMLVFPADSFH